jgi:glycosyltransferase involved in cell wall biosynthesis
VCCTLQGEELFLDDLVPPFREQARALIREQTRAIDRFVAVSDYCGAFMSSYLTIPPPQISVVPLGINMEGYEKPQGGSQGVFTIGYFARIAPEKGLHVLAEAFVRLRQRTAATPMRLDVAGYLSRANQSYLDRARRTLEAAGYGQEFSYRGELDRAGKIAFLRQLDVLSVPATYDEPKGMFLLEAMAGGVPVVQPRRGAFVEMVERTGGGLLVAPDNPDALAEGLHAVWSSAANRSAMAARAFHGVRAHYTVSHSAERLLDVYGSILSRASVSVA